MKINDLKSLPIVMFSMSRWDGVSSASLSLAKEFSKFTKVFYIDNPLTYKDYVFRYNNSEIIFRRNLKKKNVKRYCNISGFPKNLIFVFPCLTIPINFLSKGFLYNQINKFNNKKVNKLIYKVLKDYNINNYILFNSFNPFYGAFLDSNHQPVLQIYQSRDNIEEAAYVSKHGSYLEKRCIIRSHYAFATSKKLTKELSIKTKKKVHYLPNAADISIFNKVHYNDFTLPKELEGIQKKIIGYIGNIEGRIDYALLNLISLKHKDKVILLVGPDNSPKNNAYPLESITNLIKIGKTNLENIPQYLKFMDCTIIPFIVNDLTKNIYPLKINEYLSAGKPVITTEFSEDLDEFEKYISIARTYDEFNDFIDYEIQSDCEYHCCSNTYECFIDWISWEKFGARILYERVNGSIRTRKVR